MRLGELFKTWRIVGSRLMAELFGGLALGAATWQPLVTLTQAASILVDAILGDLFVVSLTTNAVFVIANPTNPPPAGFSQVIVITIRNTVGGAHGAGTFGTLYKTSAAVPAIANANSRSFCFRWDGTNWVELWRTAADVAN
jgi:hypothetical protein